MTTLDTIPSSSLAHNDDTLISLWLHGRPKHTRRAYVREADRLIKFIHENIQPDATLRDLTLQSLQTFADGLDGSASTKRRALAAIKSLCSFAHKLGYLMFDVARPLRISGKKTTITAERILSEGQVQAMIANAGNERNRILLKTLYASGARVSELAELKWKDCTPLNKPPIVGQITVVGKGDKTRPIGLNQSVWDDLLSLKTENSTRNSFVFEGYKGGHLDVSHIFRIVQSAAKTANIPGMISPHWLRHAHASHALDRGSPISLLQATLGHLDISTTGQYLHARPGESSATYLNI